MIINNKLLYTGYNSSAEPYFYDFVANNAGLIKDVNPYFNYPSNPYFIKYSYFHKTKENLCYFLADNPDDGKELYVTDGTSAGTILTRNTFPGTMGININYIFNPSDFQSMFNYHGDTIFCVSDSIRYYYKNTYYKAYKNPSINVSSCRIIEAYLAIGTTDIYHSITSDPTNNPAKSGKIFNTTNPNFSDTLSAFNCSGSNGGFTGSVLFDMNQDTDVLGNAIFLKKDSCYYFVQKNCNSTSLTGYELYRYCNKSMFTIGINEIATLQNQVSVFPNPSTSQFNFNGLVGENIIQITDITGRIFISEKTYTENHTLKLEAAQGIYFYKITDKQNRIQQGKLILN